MPELWELCNTESMAELIELYCIEHGRYPDFYYILLGEFMSPEEEHLAEVNKEMSQVPSNRKGGCELNDGI